MTIYIDIVFIENIIMNYILLLGTGLIQKTKIKKSRLITSSLLGTIYSIIEYMKIIPIYSTAFMKILLSIIMIYIAFYPQSVKKMLKSLALFYLITFTTGGCAFGLMYLINPKALFIKNGIVIISHPFKLSFIAGLIGFVIIQYSFHNNKRKLNKKDMICKIQIKICGKLLNTKAYIDSGNTLRDPLTNIPVIIIEEKTLNQIIDVDKQIIKGGDEKLKVRWIPYKTIGKSKGILMGIKAEYVEIQYEEETTIVDDVIIGIYNNVISKNYSALVGLNLIEGGKKSEYNVNIEKDIFQSSKKQ